MKINEIFQSLQGEGFFTGTPAVFIRMSGCNLNCNFCDTNHNPWHEMSESEIIHEISKFPAKHIVITGGEPTLQLNCELLQKLHHAGKFIQIETNGTQPLTNTLLNLIDWITVSPKNGAIPRIQRIDELKIVFDTQHPRHIKNLETVILKNPHAYFLQPCHRTDPQLTQTNLRACIDYILTHPKWRLSLQTHKIINIP